MLVTLLGITILVKLSQYSNADSPMLELPVIITSFNDLGINTLFLNEELLPPNIYPKLLSDIPFNLFPINGNVIFVKLSQP